MHRDGPGFAKCGLRRREAIEATRSEKETGTFRSKGEGAGSADAGTGAGNEDNLIFQADLSHVFNRIEPSGDVARLDRSLCMGFEAFFQAVITSRPIGVFHAGFEGAMKGGEEEIRERGRELLGPRRLAEETHV